MEKSLGEVSPLHQRLLELERSNRQYQQKIEQLSQQLTQERAARQQAEEQLQVALASAQKSRQVNNFLRESEQRLKLAQRIGGIGTWEWNLISNEVSWSEGIWSLLALEPNSITPTLEAFIQFIHPDDRARVFQELEAALANDNLFYSEFRVIRQDGVLCWFLSKGQVLRTADGQPQWLLGINIDITIRKQTEMALQLSEARLQGFVTANVLGILFGDLEGGIQEANDEFLRIVGYTREDLQSGRLRWIDITPPEYLPLDEAAIVEARKRGACTPYEKEYIRKDGSRVPVLVGFGLVLAVREEAVAFILDLSDRKQAEESLRQSEERLRLALLVGQSGIWDWDIVNNRITWSEQIYQFHGLTPETFSGKVEDFVKLIHPEDQEKISVAIRQALEERSHYAIEFRTIQPTGVIRWLSTTGGVIFDPQGHPLRMLGATIDITDRKVIEAEREQLLKREQTAREQAEAANRVKDEFLAVLSHELRTPLSPILGWTQLLRTRQFDGPVRDRALETIERNAKLQAQLIEDLLDVSRILQGKLSLKVSTVNLVQIVEAALETVRLSAEAKGIQVLLTLALETGQVNGDANRLQQVIWNLLSNAVKFTRPGGQVEVRLEEVANLGGNPISQGEDQQTSDLCPTSLPRYVQITVNDTGEGISPEFLPYVFDTFRQADSSTTRQFGGLGLGLAIVRHLVELHGGRVQASSAGKSLGASFSITLPLMVEASTIPATGQPLDLTLTLNSLQILVVDDDHDTRDFVAFALDQAGAKVFTAASGREALAYLAQSQPDLLLSDIGMPEMDGYTLIRQIRSLQPEAGGEIPAIALTAFAGEINHQQAIAVGFQHHISKPVEPEELVKTIVQVMQQKQLNSN